MSARNIADFWRRQGRRVVDVDGVCWYAQRPWVMSSLPDHSPIEPSARTVREVARRGHALLIRYPSGGDPTPGKGVFTCEDRGYDLPSIHPKARAQTRGGLADCSIERIDPRLLARAGYALNVDTWARQGRSRRTMSRATWQRYCAAAGETEGFEVWAAYVGTQFAAFVVCALADDCYTILFQSSSTDLLPNHPNNALAYAVTRRALDRPDVSMVSYGLRSVEPTPGLDRFKERMGFVIRPYRENLVATPVAKQLLSFGGGTALRVLARCFPSNDFCRKAANLAHALSV